MWWRLSLEGASYQGERDNWLQEIAVSTEEAVSSRIVPVSQDVSIFFRNIMAGKSIRDLG
jgi:hypothetical protein